MNPARPQGTDGASLGVSYASLVAASIIAMMPAQDRRRQRRPSVDKAFQIAVAFVLTADCTAGI